MRSFHKGKLDFQVIPIDNQTHRALARLRSHFRQEAPERRRLLLKSFFARIALYDNRLVQKQPAALRVISPDSASLGEGSRAAEALAQDLQGFVDPILLVNWLIIPVP